MARGETPRLNLGVWDDGDNPGAGSKTELTGNTGLNGNWLKIDLAVGAEHNADGTHKTGVIKAHNLSPDVVDGLTLVQDPTTKKLKVGSLSSAQINNLSITSEKIQDGAVTGPKIADGSINSSKLDKENLGIYYSEITYFSFYENDPIQTSAWINGIKCDAFWGYVFFSDTTEEVKILAQARFGVSPRIIETAQTITTLSPGDVLWVYRDGDDLINIVKNNQVILQLTRPAPVFTGQGQVIVRVGRKVRGYR